MNWRETWAYTKGNDFGTRLKCMFLAWIIYRFCRNIEAQNKIEKESGEGSAK